MHNLRVGIFCWSHSDVKQTQPELKFDYGPSKVNMEQSERILLQESNLSRVKCGVLASNLCPSMSEPMDSIPTGEARLSKRADFKHF